MYKIISILAFILMLSQIDSFAINTNTEFNLEDEEYVNDIPFNTGDIICLDLDTSNNEDYSDLDFEFSLKMIVANKIMNVNFYLQEEDYIDDIPFNTESVVDETPIYLDAAFNECMSVEFQLEEEDYIDDIPFNTCDVVKANRP